jgi:hypothetical protein
MPHDHVDLGMTEHCGERDKINSCFSHPGSPGMAKIVWVEWSDFAAFNARSWALLTFGTG